MADITHDPNLAKKPVNELIAVGQTFNVQITQVDKSSGYVKVSRKKLLNPDEPDNLTPTVTNTIADNETTDDSESLAPSFPTTPPRRWNPDYFKRNVATTDDISNALNNIPQSYGIK